MKLELKDTPSGTEFPTKIGEACSQVRISSDNKNIAFEFKNSEIAMEFVRNLKGFGISDSKMETSFLSLPCKVYVKCAYSTSSGHYYFDINDQGILSKLMQFFKENNLDKNFSFVNNQLIFKKPVESLSVPSSISSPSPSAPSSSVMSTTASVSSLSDGLTTEQADQFLTDLHTYYPGTSKCKYQQISNAILDDGKLTAVEKVKCAATIFQIVDTLTAIAMREKIIKNRPIKKFLRTLGFLQSDIDAQKLLNYLIMSENIVKIQEVLSRQTTYSTLESEFTTIIHECNKLLGCGIVEHDSNFHVTFADNSKGFGLVFLHGMVYDEREKQSFITALQDKLKNKFDLSTVFKLDSSGWLYFAEAKKCDDCYIVNLPKGFGKQIKDLLSGIADPIIFEHQQGALFCDDIDVIVFAPTSKIHSSSLPPLTVPSKYKVRTSKPTDVKSTDRINIAFECETQDAAFALSAKLWRIGVTGMQHDSQNSPKNLYFPAQKKNGEIILDCKPEHQEELLLFLTGNIGINFKIKSNKIIFVTEQDLTSQVSSSVSSISTLSGFPQLPKSQPTPTAPTAQETLTPPPPPPVVPDPGLASSAPYSPIIFTPPKPEMKIEAKTRELTIQEAATLLMKFKSDLENFSSIFKMRDTETSDLSSMPVSTVIVNIIHLLELIAEKKSTQKPTTLYPEILNPFYKGQIPAAVALNSDKFNAHKALNYINLYWLDYFFLFPASSTTQSYFNKIAQFRCELFNLLNPEPIVRIGMYATEKRKSYESELAFNFSFAGLPDFTLRDEMVVISRGSAGNFEDKPGKLYLKIEENHRENAAYYQVACLTYEGGEKMREFLAKHQSKFSNPKALPVICGDFLIHYPMNLEDKLTPPRAASLNENFLCIRSQTQESALRFWLQLIELGVPRGSIIL